VTAAAVVVRDERAEDREAVHRVNALAFGQRAEADLVDALRAAGAAIVSKVAVLDGEIVGHVLLSPVTIAAPGGEREALGLAPVGVLPRCQRQGIGSTLVRRALDECRQRGVGLVVVLGHPAFYPRFGFTPAAPFGLCYDERAPSGAFMVAELQPGALRGASGVVRYRPEFAGL
jgi:putative acetyltransferase